jgi:tetratricopeptide (TPR) repeat protein
METWMILPFVVPRQSLTGANAYQNSDCNQDSEIDSEIADFTKAIALSPEDAWAIFFRGMAYETKGEFDSALADYDKLIALKPKNANTYIVRGLAYADWGEDDCAIADFRRALEIDPPNQSAKNSLKALGVTP